MKIPKNANKYNLMKTFKQYNNKPQIEQYVVCEEESTYEIDAPKEMIMFVKNNIGKLVEIYQLDWEYPYIVQFENIPKSQKRNFQIIGNFENCRAYNRSEIKHFSKNKEDCLIFIEGEKYNL